MTSTLSLLRSRLGMIVTVAVVMVAALSVTMLSTAGASTHRSRHRSHHSCIPQHNGGDRDSDNRGGPSDGDGCV